MAASYQTGTPSSPTNLLQSLVTWLVTQGWTSNMSQADGTGWRAHLSKSGNYINLRATPGNESIWGFSTGGNTTMFGIGLYLGTGFSSGSSWHAQAGAPIGNGQTYSVGAFMQTPTGAMSAYHFFDDGSDNIVVVVERTSGIYTHMGWGASLSKAGTWTGGPYFFAPWSAYLGQTATNGTPGTSSSSAFTPFCYGDNNGFINSFVRADVDAFTNKWLSNGNQTTAQYGWTGKRCTSGHLLTVALPVEVPQYSAALMSRLTSAMNGQAVLLPVRVYASRDAGGYSLLGDVPNLFVSNGAGYGFVSASIYPIGAENYMMFPNFAVRKWA